MIASFINQTNDSSISEEEKSSSVGSLSNLNQGSFSGALKTFAKSISAPEEIQGFKPVELASKSIELRNKIAHKVDITEGVESINLVTKGIREMTLGLLWSKYNLPEFRVVRPPDNVNAERVEIKLM